MSSVCGSIAPAVVTSCVPVGKDGLLRTPWCHLLQGHGGPCQCGEFRWQETTMNEDKQRGDK